MKTYNLKLFATTVLVICCAIIFTACSDKDNDSDSKDIYTLKIEQAQKLVYYVTQKVFQDANIEKTPFTQWIKGEKVEVYINYRTVGAYPHHLGTLIAQEDGFSTTLQGNINLEGYDIDNLFSSNENISLLLVTSPTIDFTKQDGTLPTILKRFANVHNYVSITGIDKEKRELMHGGSGDFYICGWARRYSLRDANGLPLKASSLTISCTDYEREILTQREDFIIGFDNASEFGQWGDIDVKLSTPSDIVYVWEELSSPVGTSETGQMTYHITAIVDGDTYTGSYSVAPIPLEEKDATFEIVMEKQ